jgi:hypothetical protein
MYNNFNLYLPRKVLYAYKDGVSSKCVVL